MSHELQPGALCGRDWLVHVGKASGGPGLNSRALLLVSNSVTREIFVNFSFFTSKKGIRIYAPCSLQPRDEDLLTHVCKGEVEFLGALLLGVI